MAGLGLIFAVIAFLIMQSLITDLVDKSFPAWIISGIVAACVAWPFFRQHREDRFTKLRPRARKFDLPLTKAWAEVLRIFDESTIEMGRKWSVSTRNTNEKHFIADISWTDTVESIDGQGTGPTSISVSTKTATYGRFLRCEGWFTEAGDSTILKLNWYPESEGADPVACDRIIDHTMALIHSALGQGDSVEGDQPRTYRPGPPLVLVIALGVAGLLFVGGINKSIDQKKDTYEQKKKELENTRQSSEKLRNARLSEIKQWDEFKRKHGL
ncbi:MAG: hypothetical protein K8F91_22765 [Candidatus Obscuribacterales bacterium]|nr:hypothetical protein [Candidatus Obscuribacterales bacterium]